MIQLCSQLAPGVMHTHTHTHARTRTHTHAHTHTHTHTHTEFIEQAVSKNQVCVPGYARSGIMSTLYNIM